MYLGIAWAHTSIFSCFSHIDNIHFFRVAGGQVESDKGEKTKAREIS